MEWLYYSLRLVACTAKLPTSLWSNRVARIQKLSKDRVWCHVTTDQNPADLLSREIQLQELSSSILWWHGPAFLSDNSQCWPKRLSCVIKSPPTEFVLATTNFQKNILDELLSQHSKFSRAIRVLAYCIKKSSFIIYWMWICPLLISRKFSYFKISFEIVYQLSKLFIKIFIINLLIPFSSIFSYTWIYYGYKFVWFIYVIYIYYVYTN